MSELINVSMDAYNAGIVDTYNAEENSISIPNGDRAMLTKIAEAFSALGFLVTYCGEVLKVQL